MNVTNKKLLISAITKYLLGLISIGLLLFIPAGTINYWNAWLLIILIFIPILIEGIILFIKDKELLQKRLNNKEKEKNQKNVIIFSLIIFVLGFILSGLDFRFKISNMSPYIMTIGCVTLLSGYALYVNVIKENRYLSRTVEIQENQKVINTGLYSIVRHPMYLATTILFLSFPIVLGSWISLVIFLFIPFILAKRIKNEETILEEGLQGYKEYKENVKYKMIPFIW